MTDQPAPTRPGRSLRGWLWRIGAAVLGLLIALAVWWLAIAVLTEPGSIQARLAPGDALATLGRVTAEGELTEHVFASLRRIIVGLLLAAAVGIPLGLLLGSAPGVARTSGGVVGILRNISPLAWTPVAIIFLGVGDAPVVFLIAVGATWPIMMNTQAGVANLDPTWLRVSRSLGATRFETMRHVVWPGVRPNVLTGVRIATGLAWVILVPAEMLGVDSGLGYFILDARDRFAYDELLAAVIAIGLLGLLIDGVTRVVFDGGRRRPRRSSASTRALPGSGLCRSHRAGELGAVSGMDKRTFFDIMGTAPAAVTVVTTLGPSGEPRGLTVAAVTSVSAEPPSLLISLDHRSKSLPDLLSAGKFGVNYLRGDRADVSRRFSSPLEERFAGVEWRPGSTGVPILHADSLSWLECRIQQAVASGDHVVLIATVEDGAPPPPQSRPLMYFRHHYEPWPGQVDDAGAAVDTAPTALDSAAAAPTPAGARDSLQGE